MKPRSSPVVALGDMIEAAIGRPGDGNARAARVLPFRFTRIGDGPMTFTRPALALLAIGLGATAYALRPRPERRRDRTRSATKSPFEPVRHAGPEEMTLKPRNWDMVDEQVDESVPASDPPANY